VAASWGIGGALPLAAEGAGDGVWFPPCPVSHAQAEIVEVGAAMYAWLVDVTSGIAGKAGPSDTLCPGSPPVDIALVPEIAVADLRALLVPDYIAAIPELDPWGNPFDFRLNVANPLSAHAIALRSAGADGALEGTLYDFHFTSGPDDDLVLYNLSIVRAPPRLDPVSRQITTVDEINRLGTALLSWYTDNVSSAAASSALPARSPLDPPPVDLALISPISHAAMTALLAPFYTPCVPVRDGWEIPYDLRLNDDLLHSPVMAIRSAGADATTEGEIYAVGQFPADDLARDIVWSDGMFFQMPDATRTTIFRDGFESSALWGYWSCGPGY